MVAGGVAGMILGTDGIGFLKVDYLKQVGDIFLKLIKMVIAPLIFFSVLTGIASLGDSKSLARVGGKATSIYILTTVIAIIIGLIIANLLNPGLGTTFDETTKYTPETFGLFDFIISVIPQPLVSVNPLKVIFFAVFFGLALHAINHEAKGVVIKFSEVCAEVMYKIVNIVMILCPYGVFGIMAYVIGTQGIGIMITLSKLVLTFFIAVAIHVSLVYLLPLRSYVKVSIPKFFQAMKTALLVAFSTASSSATLPTTLKCAKERLGVSDSTANFVFPLGSTINMDGSALYQGILAVFASQLFGIELTVSQMAIVVCTVTASSIGTSGTPGGGLVILSLVLAAVGLSAEQQVTAIGVILGVDRILDMFRTAMNVTGDSVVAALVDKSEGSFDPKLCENWEKDQFDYEAS